MIHEDEYVKLLETINRKVLSPGEYLCDVCGQLFDSDRDIEVDYVEKLSLAMLELDDEEYERISEVIKELEEEEKITICYKCVETDDFD